MIRAPLADAELAAARVRERVEAEARLVLESARAEAAAIREAARDEGRREGLASIAALEARSLETRARAVEEAERAVLGLVTKLVERVLHDTLEGAPERIVPIVRAQLERIRRAKHVEIRVHPDDVAALEAALARHALTRAGASARVEGDPSITRGGCVLTSDLGTIDAQLELQLAAFARALESAS